MPLWAALIATFGSGAIGTVVATLLRIGHERDSDLRPKMLAAADELSRRVDGAQRLTVAAIELRYEGGGPSEEDVIEDLEDWADSETVDAIASARTGWQHAAAQLSTVYLTFGEDSPASMAAVKAIELGSSALGVIEPVPADARFLAEAYLAECQLHMRDFHRAARGRIRRPQAGRFGDERRRRVTDAAIERGKAAWVKGMGR